MKLRDRESVSLQFKLQIYSKNGTDFQTFFENIMEKAFRDFQRIRPHGTIGDAGNDGYRKDSGAYYQVYAPITPHVGGAEAARKLIADFSKLQKGWSHVSEIREYNFVFNDKYLGSVKPLEEAIATLEAQHPTIKFRLFLAKDLEDVFFRLDDAAILSLGFNIDQRQSIANAHSILENVKTALDREDAVFGWKLLENIKEIIVSLADPGLSLEFELLQYRCLQKLENVDEARQGYESLANRFPDDPRPLLYLAEIHLTDGEFDKNAELLEHAGAIDNANWLLRLERLVRQIVLGPRIDPGTVDESAFPIEPRIRANFYRLYGLGLQQSGEGGKADSFIAQAIHLDPARFAGHRDELAILEAKIGSSKDASERIRLSELLLAKIEEVVNRFSQLGDIGPRNEATLMTKQLGALLVQSKLAEMEGVAKDTFALLMRCHFDLQIDHMLSIVVGLISIPDDGLKQLLQYLKSSKNPVSDALAKGLIAQFSIRGTLLTEGQQFFGELHNQRFVDLIRDIEKQNYKSVLQQLEGDVVFAIGLANTLKDLPDLRKMIIENLPDDKEIQKEKLWMLLNFDEKEFDKAFEILKGLDLSALDYLECRPILQIAHGNKAWDMKVTILEKLLKNETGEREVFDLQLQLLDAYHHLGKYQEVMDLGEELLATDKAKGFLSSTNKEALLIATLHAGLERGKVDNDAFLRAKGVLEKYPLADPSLEFKAGLEAETYLSNNEVANALRSVIDGVKLRRILSPQEYARLYFVLSVKIGNAMPLDLAPSDTVQDNTFVKLSGKDQWYCVGGDNELDAVLIARGNERYGMLIGKRPGDKILFEDKYGSGRRESVIETVLPIEQYVLWQTVHHFQHLAQQGDLEGVHLIEIPQTEGAIDLRYLLSFLEDINTKTEPLFEMFCKNQIPLAVLAVGEGGLTNAIGRIQREGRGFINCSIGTAEELGQQKELARRIVHDQIPFYVDGTSALMLSEIGLLPKIHDCLPNAKVPQSVINLLADTSAKLGYSVGESGQMGYAKGQLRLMSLDKGRRDLIRANFAASVKSLEARTENIGVISTALKADCFSERKIAPELSDACILAQREGLPVLTEDLFYLKMNEIETKKKAPQYVSSLVLLRLLYEEGLIGFDVYLDYFGYLSSYRFRFLSLSADDIEKAVFGDGKVKVVNPTNIRKLNLPLTLSKEYGVEFRTLLAVVGSFLLKVLLDDSVTPEVAQSIFIEIIEAVPTELDRRALGQVLLRSCLGAIESKDPKAFSRPENRLLQRKVDGLMQLTQVYASESKLWTPS